MTDVDLDRWSAEVLMGWKWSATWSKGSCVGAWHNKDGKLIMLELTWHPSSPDSPAWQILAVIEAMRKEGFGFIIIAGYIGFTINCVPLEKLPEKSLSGAGTYPSMEIGILKAAYAAKEGNSTGTVQK